MSDGALRIHEALKLAIGFGYPGGLTYYDELDPHGVGPLLYRLSDGAWHATGRREHGVNAPPAKREVIPTDWWEFLIPEADSDSATGGGMKFCAIRIHRGSPSTPAKKTIAAETGCLQWLTDVMAKTEKTKTKDGYRDEATNRFEGRLAGKAFTRAWAAAVETTPAGSTWRKRGPPVSS